MNSTVHRPRTVIDAHQHIGDISVTGATSGGPVGAPTPATSELDGDVESRLAMLTSRGVDKTVIIGAHAHLRPDGIADTRRMNDGVAAYRLRRPDRFVAGIGIVEPLYGARGLDEVTRCADELNFAGLSFHTRFQGVSNDSPWVRRIIERMGERGMVVFMHAVGESAAEALWKVELVANDFPDMCFVVLDAFSTFEQSMFIPHVADRCPNLVFDTATNHGWGFVAPLVNRCGASRLVYGSDLHSGAAGHSPLHDPLGDILTATLEEADREAILGGNIARILHLDITPASA